MAPKFSCSCWDGLQIKDLLIATFGFLGLRSIRDESRTTMDARQGFAWLSMSRPNEYGPYATFLERLDSQVCNALMIDFIGATSQHSFNSQKTSNVSLNGWKTSTLLKRLSGDDAQDIEYCPFGFVALSYICAETQSVHGWFNEAGLFQVVDVSHWLIVAPFMEVFIKLATMPQVQQCFERQAHDWPFSLGDIIHTYAAWIHEQYLNFYRYPPHSTITEIDALVGRLLGFGANTVPAGIRWRPSPSFEMCSEVDQPTATKLHGIDRVAVACLPLAVWPQEQVAMEDFERIVRPHCDWFATFVALHDGNTHKDIPKDWSVVDLASAYPQLVQADHWESLPNSLQKFSASVLYADDHFSNVMYAEGVSKEWWFCHLETDVPYTEALHCIAELELVQHGVGGKS